MRDLSFSEIEFVSGGEDPVCTTSEDGNVTSCSCPSGAQIEITIDTDGTISGPTCASN